MQTYYVRVALKDDSVRYIAHENVAHVEWKESGKILALEFGEREIDRRYIYYPVERIDYVEVQEENERE